MMRNSTGGTTSSAKKSQQNTTSSNNDEKNSAKKLVQARLPFKVIAPGSSPTIAAESSAAATTTTPKEKDALKEGKTPKQQQKETKDARKRKLSYGSEDEAEEVQEIDNVSKENVEVKSVATVKKKKINSTSTTANNEDQVEVVSLLDDEEDEEDNGKNTSLVKASSSKAGGTTLKTPKVGTKGKTKGAGTPQQTPGSGRKDKSGGNHTKLQIKLPLSAGKRNKRRKSKANTSLLDTSQHNNSCADSCDDIDEIAGELNPQKRTKLDYEEKEEKSPSQEKTEESSKENIVCLDSDSGSEETKKPEKANESRKSSRIATNDNKKSEAKSVKESEKPSESNKKTEAKSVKDSAKPSESNKKSEAKNAKESEKPSESNQKSEAKSVKESAKPSENNKKSEAKSVKESGKESKKVLPNKKDEAETSIVINSDDDKNIDESENEEDDEDADEDADDERDATTKNTANESTDNHDDSKEIDKHNKTVDSVKDAENDGLKNKNLTPKQKKLLEQRQKAREEKERKLQEEKRKKQQEKEEKELAKKREREEKEEQKRKEREEKEEQKRKEREEKERKRLAEIEAKNEEKRKRNEAKEEELRKKDEERKRKEQEKEEAELKKKKAAEAFTKFFVAKAPSANQQNLEDDENTGDGTKSLAFRPFQIKGDMKLAPINRKILSEDSKNRIDHLLGLRSDDDEEDIVRAKPLPKSKLYLSELRSGQILPGKWRRPSTDSKDDVVIIEDDLERVGEAIVEDTPAYIREEMRVKFYKFHDNRRPPYYGTWRKKSKVITGRRPFAQDTKFCDYEVDSDDEWEEEEPGESLEDGSDDDKEKESEDDDYEVDNEWFVPHGHLSEEEMQNEDELGDDCNDREAQKAKLKIIQQEFAQEMKKKTEKIKPRLIGCIWIESSGKQPESCPTIIWEKLNTRAMLCTDPPLLEEPEIEEPPSPSASNSGNNEKSSVPEKIKPVTVTEAMIKDLVRLLHGNNNSKAFLIKEFIAFIAKTEESVINGEFANPLKSVIREKIDSMAEWQIVDAQPQASEDLNESLKKKKKTKKRLCWVVNKETLDKLDMSSLSLQNNWEYILTPKLKSDNTKTEEGANNPETVETPTVNSDDSKANNEPFNNIVDNNKESKTKSVNSPITKFTKVLTKAEKEAIAKKDKSSSSTSTPTRNTSSNSSPKAESNKKSTLENKTKTSPGNKEKKRVPLLMSVARGQQVSTPAKNKLISQFLQKGNTSKQSSPNSTKRNSIATSSSSTVVNGGDVADDDDDVVILD
ncbi:chromatin assembly factor 1, p180 subunit [Musca autumnalis]|uniref:chromatin assembly factor 1, p180 subunit n=1 Tax=Musca autumnalis TaxID=221902 RepID=UPI003CEB6E17